MNPDEYALREAGWISPALADFHFKQFAALQLERDAAWRSAETAQDALEDIREAVARIRALHCPTRPPEGQEWVSGGTAPHCEGCTTGDPFIDQEWPCLTIRALNGGAA